MKLLQKPPVMALACAKIDINENKHLPVHSKRLNYGLPRDLSYSSHIDRESYVCLTPPSPLSRQEATDSRQHQLGSSKNFRPFTLKWRKHIEVKQQIQQAVKMHPVPIT